MKDLKIIVPPNFTSFGDKVNGHIQRMRGTDKNYLVNTDFVRFNNGEGKVLVKETLRDSDLYIMTDVTNYGITYQAYGYPHHMMPDEHFTDIKRILSAECGHAHKRTLIMPYLYESRQDKKEDRESLDCANALDELERMGVNEFITCDVHNKAIMNAVPNRPFENVYLSDALMWDMLCHERICDFSKIVCVSTDEGGMKRAKFFSGLIGNAELGSFYKQKDYTKVIDGKNPIIDHRFLGPDMQGKYAIVVDDMIASGSSILDTAKSLKKLGAEKIYLIVTFALFTSGIDKFDEYYQNGMFNKVYASNLCYVPEEYLSKPWFKSVDCSYRLANIINELNYGHSIGELISCRTETAVKIKKLRKKNESYK
jgi:ribose-phosphate pyrophosphokinase